MSRLFNSTVLGFCAVLFIAGAKPREPKQIQYTPIYQPMEAPVQRPTLEVRPALWTDSKLPSTYSTVSYAGGCADGSCSILGNHRSGGSACASGEGSPVWRLFGGLRDRQPVRRLFGRLRGRCG